MKDQKIRKDGGVSKHLAIGFLSWSDQSTNKPSVAQDRSNWLDFAWKPALNFFVGSATFGILSLSSRPEMLWSSHVLLSVVPLWLVRSIQQTHANDVSFRLFLSCGIVLMFLLILACLNIWMKWQCELNLPHLGSDQKVPLNLEIFSQMTRKFEDSWFLLDLQTLSNWLCFARS